MRFSIEGCGRAWISVSGAEAVEAVVDLRPVRHLVRPPVRIGRACPHQFMCRSRQERGSEGASQPCRGLWEAGTLYAVRGFEEMESRML